MAKVTENKHIDIKFKKRYKQFEFDKLQMYFGEPYTINLENVNGSITVYQPTIGNILKLGENKFYATLNIFVTNTTACRLMLWQVKQDWNVLSDFELFVMLYRSIDPDASKLIFGDLDFSKFEPSIKNESLVLYNADDDIEINEEVYQMISQYLQNVFKIFPEEEFTKDNMLKRWWIQKDQRENEKNKKKNDEMKGSSLQPVISACVNHPGFKYNLQELRNVGVCEFYDSVKRLQVYESTTALLHGMYSGMVDTKKIEPDEFNWMRE